mmetsp:Transcript_92392/g.261567  ORF Transcript_92392/g.261567 Transcript_92392/m.261567 type:complete len:210 (+) Transcript_92392:242-871(+)
MWRWTTRCCLRGWGSSPSGMGSCASSCSSAGPWPSNWADCCWPCWATAASFASRDFNRFVASLAFCLSWMRRRRSRCSCLSASSFLAASVLLCSLSMSIASISASRAFLARTSSSFLVSHSLTPFAFSRVRSLPTASVSSICALIFSSFVDCSCLRLDFCSFCFSARSASFFAFTSSMSLITASFSFSVRLSMLSTLARTNFPPWSTPP